MNILFQDTLGQPLWLWLSFLGLVCALLFLDLGVFQKKDHVIGMRESLHMSFVYIVLGLLFGLWVWLQNGSDGAMDYYTVYLLEKSLSMDNLFVMSVIFSSLCIPREYQHRVLFWGILGVIILRGGMIVAGTALVSHYEWVLFIFALILIWTGYKLLQTEEEEHVDYSQKPYVRFLARYMRVTDHLHGHNFFTRAPLHGQTDKTGWHATPLLLALCVIELTDVMFAFDSVPAALAVTTDTYIVFTANIFAILGLRALYFAMASILHRLEYLKYSLSIVIIFIGLKVFYVHFFGKMHPALSLGITASVLAAGVIWSLVKTRTPQQDK